MCAVITLQGLETEAAAAYTRAQTMLEILVLEAAKELIRAKTTKDRLVTKAVTPIMVLPAVTILV